MSEQESYDDKIESFYQKRPFKTVGRRDHPPLDSQLFFANPHFCPTKW